jgi:N4-gp56 family major capsid protein
VAPLSEAYPPKGQKLNFTDYTATLEMYGDHVELTRKVADMHEDPVLSESVNLCGEQAAETIEFLRFMVLRAGTNVYYANGVASRSAVNSPPLRGDFRKIVRGFKRNKAKEISRIISASAKVSTEPVGAAYFAMGHTDLDSDLRNISGFTPVEQYSQASKAMPGEIGKIENIRFILTALFEPWQAAGASGEVYLANGSAPSSSTACDVYPLIIVAQNAYGIVPLQGMNAAQISVVNPGKATKDDPHGQIGFVSWTTYQAAAILNQNWIARLECACTANPS